MLLYRRDDAPRAELASPANQSYLAQIQHNTLPNGKFLYHIDIEYDFDGPNEQRPDPILSYRAGFALQTNWRARAIEVTLAQDPIRLCRRYELAYDDSGPARLSLLHSVLIVGEKADGSRLELSPITFGYSKADEASRVLRDVQGAPSVSLGHSEYEVVDLTGTATPDVLYAPAAFDHWYFLNRGGYSMASVAKMPTAPSASLPEVQTRLGDIKGLVAADLFTRNHVFSNPSIRHGRRLRDTLEWGDQEEITGFPVFADTQLPEVRVLDLTGDGRLDILRTGYTFDMWFQRPDQTFVAQPPVDRVHSYLQDEWPDVNFADECIKLADMTGDGMMDIVRVDRYAARVDYWPYQGEGCWGKKRMLFYDADGLTFPLSAGRMFFDDVDNNGFADLIYVDTQRVFLWPNQGGKSFGLRQQIGGVPQVGSAALRVGAIG